MKNSGIYDLLAKLKAHSQMEHLGGVQPSPMAPPQPAGMPIAGPRPPIPGMMAHPPMPPMAPPAPQGPMMPGIPGMKANHPFGKR